LQPETGLRTTGKECDGPNKSLQDILHRGKGFITCSRTKGLYFEDLKLEKEEEGEGGER
jgi:hypothetical protein